MFKLNTQLAYFRFDNILNQGPLNISWSVIEKNGNTEKQRCFTSAELEAFRSYASKNPNNFGETHDQHPCTQNNTPTLDTGYSHALQFPSHIIIRQKPQLSDTPTIHHSMDVILTDSLGRDKHTYNLSFDVIGKVE